MKNFSLFSLCSALFIVVGSHSAYSTHVIDDELMCIMEKLGEVSGENPDSAFLLLNKGISLSIKRKDSLSLAVFYLKKGWLHHLKSHKMALEYYFKAKKIFQSMPGQDGLHIANLHIAKIYSLSFQQRKNLVQDAMEYFRKSQNTLMLIDSYSTMSQIYNQNGMKDSALHYIKVAFEFSQATDNKALLASMLSNIGTAYFDSKKYTEALNYYKKALEVALNSEQRQDFIFHIKHRLAIYYLQRNDLDSALHYYFQIKKNFDRVPESRGTFYRELSNYYRRAGNADKTLEYYLKSDSIMTVLKQERSSNALDLLELEYQSRMKEDRMRYLNSEIKKAGYIRFLLLSVILLTFIFSGILLWQQNQKARKTKELLSSKQKLLEAELQNSEFKRQVLDDKLKYTNKELTSFATNIVQNHNIINDIKDRIAVINRQKNLDEVRKQMHDLQVMLLQVFNNNAHRHEFIRRSQNLNRSLVYYLKTHFPELTESDINILILILLNFSSKEISVLYNIEEYSIRQRRYRIRKKLPIENGETFEDFFKKILPEMEIYEQTQA